MEIRVIRITGDKQDRISIECHEITNQVRSIVNFVKSTQMTISGEIDDREYEISVQDIYYLESVDNKTYMCTKDKVYLISDRLYELETRLEDASFLRISKAVIVNLLKISSIKPALNGRFSAVLANGEEVIISRKYVPMLKEKIRGERK